MPEIKPTKMKYIKLGEGGKWEKECIEERQTLRIGFSEADHSLCLAKNWRAIKDYYEGEGRKSGPSTGFVNQIKDFYEADASVLWITFYNRRLWWCFSEAAITRLPDKTKTRPVIGAWSDESIDGIELKVDHLSGKLLRVQGFRGTICSVLESEYVLKKINGTELAVTTQARTALRQLRDSLKDLVQHLHWKDFEILVDLIFRQAGWQRLGVVGKTEKDIDLDLLSPVLAQRCFVQIKSSSAVGEFEKSCDDFEAMTQFHQMFYVVHTPNDPLSQIKPSNDKIKLLMLEEIATLTISSGLVEWLIEKTS